jgi:hypothetical protein
VNDVVVFCDPGKAAGIRYSWSMTVGQGDPQSKLRWMRSSKWSNIPLTPSMSLQRARPAKLQPIKLRLWNKPEHPRMSLRQKLLLVALCTLALPVAGWLYVRQMETLLRQGQEQALTATATAVARSLAVTDAPLPQSGKGWYVQQAVNPITIDGYGDDWAPMTPWSQPHRHEGKLLLAEDDNGFYMYIDVRTARRTRADAGDANAMSADHLVLDLVQGSIHRRYLMASAAPGAFTALPLDPAAAICRTELLVNGRKMAAVIARNCVCRRPWIERWAWVFIRQPMAAIHWRQKKDRCGVTRPIWRRSLAGWHPMTRVRV